MVATAIESMTSFQNANAAFRSDAPSLSSTEPALAFVRTPRWRFRAATRQHNAANAAGRRGLFVGRGAEAAIAGGQIWRTAEDRPMAIQRRGPQRDIGRSLCVDVVGRDDLLF